MKTAQRLRVRAVALTCALVLVVSGTGVSAASKVKTIVRTNIKTSSRVLARDSVTQRTYDPRALGEEGLALLRFDWQRALPGWQVVFFPEKAGYLGLTKRLERRIEIYVRPDRGPLGVAHDIGHELGHAVDLTFNSPDDRARYLVMRGLDEATPWWACNGCRDLSVGAGDFAESFAQWAAPPYRFYSTLAPAPTQSELATMADQLFSVVQEPSPIRGRDQESLLARP